jgi:hypothetical protein
MFEFLGAIMKIIVTLVTLSAFASAQAAWEIKNWTHSVSGRNRTFTNTSASGTVTATSVYPGIIEVANTFGLPTAISPVNTITCGMQVIGSNSSLNIPMDVTFSSGYNWGVSGGAVVLGNIHNYYKYRLEAWDFSNNQINVNSWNIAAEYNSASPGVSGYFSTSSTQRTAVGLASDFFVYDTAASTNGGLGGVMLITGLMNVGKMRLTFVDNNLAPNGQSSDFIIFNVATSSPVPEPVTCATLGLGCEDDERTN